LSISAAGHPSALVRRSRASRGGCRHGCRQKILQESVDLLGKPIALVGRLIAIPVRLPRHTYENARRLQAVSQMGGAVGCRRLRP
jgi:hypothetical protein